MAGQFGRSLSLQLQAFCRHGAHQNVGWTEHSDAHHAHGTNSMGCTALSPSNKWLFLQFSGHPEDKSLMLKVLLVGGSGKNSRITAAEQRNISDMFLPFGPFNAGSCTLFVVPIIPLTKGMLNVVCPADRPARTGAL